MLCRCHASFNMKLAVVVTVSAALPCSILLYHVFDAIPPVTAQDGLYKTCLLSHSSRVMLYVSLDGVSVMIGLSIYDQTMPGRTQHSLDSPRTEEEDP